MSFAFMLVDITCILHCAHMKYPLPFPLLKFQVSSWSTLPEDTWTIPSNFICLTHHVSTSSPQPEDIWTILSHFILLALHVSSKSPLLKDTWTIPSHFMSDTPCFLEVSLTPTHRTIHPFPIPGISGFHYLDIPPPWPAAAFIPNPIIIIPAHSYCQITLVIRVFVTTNIIIRNSTQCAQLLL